MAHTPGPWHPGHLGSELSCQCANVVDEGYAGGICTVHIDNGKPISEGGNDSPPRDEAIANMHLISAAPDLLEALKEILKIRSGRTVKAARAAIAKAEGR